MRSPDRSRRYADCLAGGGGDRCGAGEPSEGGFGVDAPMVTRRAPPVQRRGGRRPVGRAAAVRACGSASRSRGRARVPRRLAAAPGGRSNGARAGCRAALDRADRLVLAISRSEATRPPRRTHPRVQLRSVNRLYAPHRLLEEAGAPHPVPSGAALERDLDATRAGDDVAQTDPRQLLLRDARGYDLCGHDARFRVRGGLRSRPARRCSLAPRCP